MSQGNVEVIRRMLDAWDSDDMRAWADGLHDEVDRVPLPEMTQTEAIHGVKETIGFLSDWTAPWERYTVEATEIVSNELQDGLITRLDQYDTLAHAGPSVGVDAMRSGA